MTKHIQHAFDRQSGAKFWLGATICVALVAAVPSRAWGATIAWDGGGTSTSWLDVLNWQGNVLPTTADDAVIVGATATITGATVPTIQSLTLGGPTSPGGLTMTATSSRASLAALNVVSVGSAGQLTLGGGTGSARSQLSAGGLSTGGTVSIGSRGDLELSGLLLQTGGTFALDGGTIAASNVVSREGLLQAKGSIQSSVRVGDGSGAASTLSPGAGIGSLSISGNLTLDSDARTRLEISASPGTLRWDTISVGGSVTLGGVLDLTQIGTGQIAPGSNISLIAGNLSPGSRFSDIVGLPVGNGSLVPSFDLTNGVHVEYTSTRGDMNGDQQVNAEDAEMFAWAIRDGNTYHQNFVLGGGAAFVSMADMDFDGDRTWADIPPFLNAVEQGGGNLQATTATLSAILAVIPEPSSLALATTPAAFALLRMRCQRRPRQSPP